MWLDVRFKPEYLQAQFSVRQSSPTKKELFWILTPQPDTDEVIEYKGFNLYYNIIPINLTKINKTLITDTHFSHLVAAYAKRDRGYYRVEAVLKDGSVISTEIKDIYVPPDAIARKISKEGLYIVLNQHDAQIDNIPLFLYARKPFGSPKCPKCNDATQGPLKSKCPTCLGSGMLGGWEGPLLIYGSYANMFSSSVSDQGNRISSEINQQMETMAEFAIIKENDYIREARSPFRLWCVSNTTMSEYNGRPLKVFCNLQVEESWHPLWETPTPLFNSPENIHYFNVREDYADILATVGKGQQTDPIPGFPEKVPPATILENYGLARYHQYAKEDLGS